MIHLLKQCICLLLLSVATSGLAAQGISARLSYDNPIIKPGTYYKASPGIDLEYNRKQDAISQLYLGLGFTYFKVRPGSYNLHDRFYPHDSVTYSNVPLIAFRAGIRGSILRKAEHSPTVGFSAGYFFVRYEQSVWRKNNPDPTTLELLGGMLALTPEIGYIFAQQKQVSYAVQARMHIAGSFDPVEMFWPILDMGVQLNYAF